MRRRDFLALAGVAAADAALPRAARTQQRLIPVTPGRGPWLIAAMVNVARAQGDSDTLGPFRKGLTALGYVEGTDFAIEARYGDADPSLDGAMARELVALRPDLFLVSSDAQAMAAHQVTATIPIVGLISLPVTIAQLIGSTASPIGNVTGLIDDVATLTGQQCGLALEIVPGARRIGALVPKGSDGALGARYAVNAAASAHKLTPVIAEVAERDVASGFRTLADQRVDVAIVASGLAGDRAAVVQSSAAAHIPTIFGEPAYAELGGLAGCGLDRKATFAKLASFADLLLRGHHVSETPVEDASSWTIAVNLQTARSLGVTIPPAVRAHADEVIG